MHSLYERLQQAKFKITVRVNVPGATVYVRPGYRIAAE